MTNNVFVKFQLFKGYVLEDGYRSYPIKRMNGFHFYNENGNVITIALKETAQFWFNIGDNPIHVRKKINFTRNEVFCIKSKGEDEYNIFIPMSVVNFKIDKVWESEDDDLGYVWKHTQMSFNGNFIGYFDNRYADDEYSHIKGNDKRTRVIVLSKTFARCTDNDKRVMALGNKIYSFVKKRLQSYKYFCTYTKFCVDFCDNY